MFRNETFNLSGETTLKVSSIEGLRIFILCDKGNIKYVLMLKATNSMPREPKLNIFFL